MTEYQKIHPEAIPLLCEGVDIKSLDVSQEEGMILAQLDGQIRVRHLKMMTQLSEEQLFLLLEKLSEKGLVKIHQPKPEREQKPEGIKAKPTGKPLIDLKEIPKGEQFKELVNKLIDVLDQVDYFQLLGVKPEASPKEIKQAYYHLSKIFHPDRYFRQVETEFRKKLQVIFKKINTAYQVLTNPESKQAYLAQISEKGVEAAVEELKIEVVKKVYTGPKWRLGLKAEDKQKAREEKLKKIVDSIKQTALGSQFQKAERIYQMALEEINKRNFKSARTNLKLAMQIDPAGSRKYQAELERIEQMENESRAELSYEEGKAAEEAGDYQRASRCYNEALKISPQNKNYLYSLARVMIKYLNNYERGRAILIQLLEMDKKNADYYFLLGLAYKGLGQKRAAEVQLEKAIELDPKHRDAQKELKALKRL